MSAGADLDRNRWPQAKALLQEALSLPSGERQGFVDSAAAADPALGAEVRALLAAHAAAPAFLEESAGELAGLAPVERQEPRGAGDLAPGAEIGPYRLVRPLASGGMGTVYLAERDDAFHRQVALKVVARGMDTDAILRRFDLEREILAHLDHPAIARLYDGGTTADGRPYFVMELVAGVPIDRFCRDHGLDVEATLRLFVKVCGAVQYAHQNLVVHRDLKPANILVAANGDPKLLDFGIAKLLDPRAAGVGGPTVDLTAFGRPMTPEYASPEQLRGDPITTASDVYSLGLLLASLLTGRLPPQATRATRPSATLEAVPLGERGALRRRLRGDLDNIVLRAMHPEPGRRYPSAERLAADLERHLDGLPVAARPDTFAYRAGKFLGRHRLGSAVAVLVSGALVASTSVAVLQARRADRRFQDVRRLANSFLFEFHDAIQDLPGATPARELVVRKALEYLDGLAREAGGDPSLLAELAQAYEKVGDVQGMPHWASLGHTEDAQHSYAKALALRQQLAAARPRDPARKLAVAEVETRIGAVEEARGQPEAARAHRREALAMTKALWERDRFAPARREAIVGQVAVADDLWEAGDRQGAVAGYQQALAAARERVREEPANRDARRHVGVIEQRLGDGARDLGHWDEALVHDRASLAVDEALAATAPASAEAQRDLATDHTRLAVSQRATGNLPAALAEHRQALALRQGLRSADPKDSRALTDLAESLAQIARVEIDLGQRAAGVESLRQALALRREQVARDPGNVHWGDDLASDLTRYGEALATDGRRAEAKTTLREALALRERLTASAPTYADNQVHLGLLYGAIGRSLSVPGGTLGREACGWLRRGGEVLAEARRKGLLSGDDAALATGVDQEVTRCGREIGP